MYNKSMSLTTAISFITVKVWTMRPPLVAWSSSALSKMLSIKHWTTTKLQQLERLRCEDTPPPHNYPYYWFILYPKSKQHKVKFTNLKNLTKLLLDNMCKYEMDLASIVEDTGQSRFCPQVDRRVDGRTDGHGKTSIPLSQLRWSRRYKDVSIFFKVPLPKGTHTFNSVHLVKMTQCTLNDILLHQDVKAILVQHDK